jgi:hypothetical protein
MRMGREGKGETAKYERGGRVLARRLKFRIKHVVLVSSFLFPNMGA